MGQMAELDLHVYALSCNCERIVKENHMSFAVIVALIIGFAVCVLPGAMAWSFYFGKQKKAVRRERVLRETKPVTGEVF